MGVVQVHHKQTRIYQPKQSAIQYTEEEHIY
jgi:hypothetical protein